MVHWVDVVMLTLATFVFTQQGPEEDALEELFIAKGTVEGQNAEHNDGQHQNAQEDDGERLGGSRHS